MNFSYFAKVSIFVIHDHGLHQGESFDFLAPSRLTRMTFLHLKGNITLKKIKMESTLLKKVSKLVHFTYFCLCE